MTESAIGRRGSLGEGRYGTVLVVDDEPAMLRLLPLVLASEGFAVIEAHSGPQAVEAAARHQGPIHVLLTDVDLSPMTGGELARRLRLARPAIRALFMATDFPCDPETPPEAQEFVTKPLGVSALVRRVRELLEAGLAEAAADVRPPADPPEPE